MSQDANQVLMSGGSPNAFAEDAAPGTRIQVRIDRAEAKQQTSLTDGSLQTWKDGSPKMMVIVHGRVEFDFTGRLKPGEPVRVFVAGNLFKQVRAAVSAAKADGLEPGGLLDITYAGLAEKAAQPGWNKAKLYTDVRYSKAVPPTVSLEPQAPPAAPVTPVQYTQQVPQQQPMQYTQAPPVAPPVQYTQQVPQQPAAPVAPPAPAAFDLSVPPPNVDAAFWGMLPDDMRRQYLAQQSQPTGF